jgi:hypothetical protein
VKMKYRDIFLLALLVGVVVSDNNVAFDGKNFAEW